MSRPLLSHARIQLGAALLVIAAALALQASAATAAPGYGPDSTTPSIALGAEVPIGLAIDQGTEEIYVAELSTGLLNKVQPGEVEQLDSGGVATADSPFTTGGQDLFVSVAVDPATHGIFAYQGEGTTPFGFKGKSTMSTFSSSGVLGSSFFPQSSEAGTLAVDSSGRVYFPNTTAGSVQVFDSSGALESTITCGGCTGGAFGRPDSLAFDAAGDLYVVDRAGNGRVVKLVPSGGSFAYGSTLQTGGSPVAVAVDGSSGDVFVGNLVGSKYHVIAYGSSGTAFDDFAADLVSQSPVEIATGQLAVNSNTHELYLSNPGGKNLWAFEPIGAIPAPTASLVTPTPVGQVEATLRANVNPKAHVLTDCHFEYVDQADFLVSEYDNARSVPCPAVIGASESVAVSTVATGLSPGTSYESRLVIASHGGADEDGNQAFQTLPAAPPEATTGEASAITLTGATLAGSVNAKGGKVSNCHFDYVTEAEFQSTVFAGAKTKVCSVTPSGTAATAVTAKATGLVAGTAYRFRVVATNNAGTTQAVEKTFATVAETCAENPASCSPPGGGGSQASTSPAPSSTPPPASVPAPIKKALKCRKGFKKKRVRGNLKCVKVRKHRRTG
jgi:hypothetical protein